MTHNMRRFPALGFSLTDVVLMSSYNPATMLGAAGELGTLAQGTAADLTVLEPVPARGGSKMRRGRPWKASSSSAPVLTLKGGEAIEPGPGPFSGGWVPAPRAET
jgi:predicted amidohydrolase